MGYDALIAPYLPVCTNDTILSLMPSRTTLWISSKSSIYVVLLVNWMVVYLLKEYNIDHYVKSKTVWYHCCWTWDTPEAQDLYKMLVHTTHETFIHRIIYFSLPSLGSKWSWQCLLKPKTPWSLVCGLQNKMQENRLNKLILIFEL